MNELLRWFNPDGSLVLPLDSYFNSDDRVCSDVVDLLDASLHKLLADSPAVALYYASKLEGTSITPYQFYTAHMAALNKENHYGY